MNTQYHSSKLLPEETTISRIDWARGRRIGVQILETIVYPLVARKVFAVLRLLDPSLGHSPTLEHQEIPIQTYPNRTREH